jgi:hypothetical protein
MYLIPAKVVTPAKHYRSKLSEMPDPDWYLGQFRSHIAKIHELFKVCPPQHWKALSSSIGDALAEVGEKAGLKAGRFIQTEEMNQGKRDLEKVE